MKRENDSTVIIDDSEFLEKDRQRKAAKKYIQHQNEEFEKEADEGKFKVISQIAETVAAIGVVIYILYELWTSLPGIWGKLLVVLILLAAASSVVFRYVAKYFYVKGDRKKFKAFNTVSKATSVSLNVADALMPGDKTIARIEKTQKAVTKVFTQGNKLSALDDDNTMYSSDNYDTYRRKCYTKGVDLVCQNRVQEVLEAARQKVQDSKLSDEDRRDIILIIFIIDDYYKKRIIDKFPEKAYYQFLGALEAFSDVGIRNNLIPNVIPGYGYVDDMFMCNCVLSEYRQEVKVYRVWRAEYRAKKNNVAKNSYLESIARSGREVLRKGRLVDILSEYDSNTGTYTSNLFRDIVESINRGEFTVEDNSKALIVGALAYWVKDKDYIPDDSLHGKFDDNAVVRFVYDAVNEDCNRYRNRESNSIDSALAKLASGGEYNE